MDAKDIYARFERVQALIPLARELDAGNEEVRRCIDPYFDEPLGGPLGPEDTLRFTNVSFAASAKLHLHLPRFLQACSEELLDFIYDVEPSEHSDDYYCYSEGWPRLYWDVRQVRSAAKSLFAAAFLDDKENDYRRTWRAGKVVFVGQLKAALDRIESYDPFRDVLVEIASSHALPSSRSRKSELDEFCDLIETAPAVVAPVHTPHGPQVEASPADVAESAGSTLEEYNVLCREFLLANADSQPSTREIRTAVGCGVGTLYKLPSFKAYREKINAGCLPKPKVVSLTDSMVNAATKGDDGELARLVREQRRDDRSDTVHARERLRSS